MSTRRLPLVLAPAAILALASAARAATPVPPGDVVNQTWNVAGSPYEVTGDITIPAGSYLHVEAGVEVHFATGDQSNGGAGGGTDAARAELVVNGDLATYGTPASTVKLLADAGPEAPASSWYGVVVASGATATLASTDVSGGASCLRLASTSAVSVTGGVIRSCAIGVEVTAGAPTLAGIEITGCAAGIRDGGGNTLLKTTTTATGLHIHGNSGNAVRLGYSDFTLADSLVHDNTGSGVYWTLNDGTHTVTVTGSTIAYNGAHGFYLNEAGGSMTAQVHDTIVAFNEQSGLVNTLGPTVYATHDVIHGNKTGNLGGTADDTGTVVENPLFVGDAMNRDLHITSRSPARGHASDGGDIGYYAWEGALTPVLAGHLFEDLTLDAAGSPHDVVGDLTVEPGHVLTVEPGATLRLGTGDYMQGGSTAYRTELRVEGTLNAAGTAAQPISFLPASITHTPGDWDGIRLLPTASGSLVDHANIGYAVYGVRSRGDGTNRIAHSEIHHSLLYGVYGDLDATVFDGVNVHDSGSYGAYLVGSTKLWNSVIHHNTSEGVHVNGGYEGAPVEIVHSTVVANGLVGIHHATGTQDFVDLVVRNSIVARHPNFGIWNEGTAGSVSVEYSDVFWSAYYYHGNVSAGVGSISSAPLFVDETTFDYRLQPASACVDAGTATGIATDIVGAPRSMDGDLDTVVAPDMGAYELAGGNAAPTAAAGTDRTIAVGEEALFDGTGSTDSDGSLVSYDWDFGDGGTASGATPTHAFASAGTYTVTLTVTDDDGATAADSLVATVFVPDTTPPDVQHTPVADGRSPGQAVAISATVLDASGVASVTLHYRATGSGAFTGVAMTGAGDTFTAEIPADAVTAVGVDYYLSAVDGASSPNTRMDPSGAPASFHHFTVASASAPASEDPSGGCGCGAGGGSPAVLALLAALLLRRRR